MLHMSRNDCNSFYGDRDQKMVAWERNWRSRHAQLQCVPLPAAKAPLALPAFRNRLAQLGIETVDEGEDEPVDEPVSTVPWFWTQSQPGSNPKQESQAYFYVACDGRRLLVLGDQVEKLPLQLGREVFCELLGLPAAAADWRAQAQAQAADGLDKQVAELRRRFAPFDFTAAPAD